MTVRMKLAAAGIGICVLAVIFMLVEGSGVPEKPVPTEPQKSASSSEKSVIGEEGHVPRNIPAQDSVKLPVVAQENLSNLYIVKCSACHGRDGKGPVGPSIAGKRYEENLAKLKQYQRGEVENTLMKDTLTRTSSEELEMLSREISAFR
jgi:cytochrome c553